MRRRCHSRCTTSRRTTRSSRPTTRHHRSDIRSRPCTGRAPWIDGPALLRVSEQDFLLHVLVPVRQPSRRRQAQRVTRGAEVEIEPVDLVTASSVLIDERRMVADELLPVDTFEDEARCGSALSGSGRYGALASTPCASSPCARAAAATAAESPEAAELAGGAVHHLAGTHNDRRRAAPLADFDRVAVRLDRGHPVQPVATQVQEPATRCEIRQDGPPRACPDQYSGCVPVITAL